jgi:hypothetical protein
MAVAGARKATVARFDVGTQTFGFTAPFDVVTDTALLSMQNAVAIKASGSTKFNTRLWRTETGVLSPVTQGAILPIDLHHVVASDGWAAVGTHYGVLAVVRLSDCRVWLIPDRSMGTAAFDYSRFSIDDTYLYLAEHSDHRSDKSWACVAPLDC